jgi:hypothetical protein
MQVKVNFKDRMNLKLKINSNFKKIIKLNFKSN